MASLRPELDPDGLLEFSVVFTDRSLNHMSLSFQEVMRDLSKQLRAIYQADSLVIVPGGGTYGMESVVRQFAGGNRCLVVRNGFFSFRWSQILDASGVAESTVVCEAHQQQDTTTAPFAPAPIEEVVEAIATFKPAVVFAPHVETASGMLLPDDYIRSLASAAHEVGALLVLDCIASGALWVDMDALDVDVLLSAPQKGWSASPCAALVLMRSRALERMASTTSSSFACDLKKWHQIMQAYEDGGHAYHATMPTDALTTFHKALHETLAFGAETASAAQVQLGQEVRQLLESRGFPSVAAPGFQAPGVVVSYAPDPGLVAQFAEQGLQIAAGVPLQCGEREDFQSFRIGLFGLDKLADVPGTVARLKGALDQIVG